MSGFGHALVVPGSHRTFQHDAQIVGVAGAESEAGFPVGEPLGDPAVPGGDHGASSAHGFDADHAEGLGPA